VQLEQQLEATHAEAPERDRVIHRLSQVGLILATPWLQLILNPSLFVTPGGNRFIDPWVYTGFFLSLRHQAARFPNTYYGSRLSWVLPGYLAHRTFSPLVANYVLHLAFFYALLFATYGLMCAAGRTRVALIATSIVAWNGVILAAVSWDYVDGAGIVFIMLALLCLERSIGAGPSRWLWAFCGGAALICLTCSNTFLLIAWPLFAALLVLRTGRSLWLTAVSIAVTAAAGAVVMYLVLAYSSVATGGGWWFLAPQLSVGRSLLRSDNPWRAPVHVWLRHAQWLVLPTVATFAAAAALAKRLRPEQGPTGAMQIVMLMAAILWLAMQRWGPPVFQITYYASYLAPFALVALILQFAPPTALRTRTVVALELCTVAIFAAVHWFVLADIVVVRSRVQQWVNTTLAFIALPVDASVAVGLAAGAFMVVGVRMIRLEWVRWSAVIVCFAIIGTCASDEVPARSDTMARSQLEETAAIHRFVDSVVGQREFRMWTPNPLATNMPILATTSSFLWGYVLVNEQFPNLTAEQASRLHKNTALVLLLPNAQDAERSHAPLRQHGYDFSAVSTRTFGSGDMAVSVVIGDLK
jgi:hypothetical protein